MNMPLRDTGLVYSGNLPLRVDALDSPPREHELQRSNEQNELLLRSVSVLEDKPDLDDTDPVSVELRRQDQKLNLILDLLGALLQQQQVLPSPRELQLTAASLRMSAGLCPRKAQLCRVELYIEPALPKPLVLYGRLEPSTQAGVAEIVFSGVNQHVADNLDKFIFRHHRRRIAQARKC